MNTMNTMLSGTHDQSDELRQCKEYCKRISEKNVLPVNLPVKRQEEQRDPKQLIKQCREYCNRIRKNNLRQEGEKRRQKEQQNSLRFIQECGNYWRR